MPQSDYMPNDDFGKSRLFALFRNNKAPLLEAIGIADNDPDVLQQTADANRFEAVLAFQRTMQTFAQSWTAAKNHERDGKGTSPRIDSVPTLPADFPPPVPPGIVGRFRALVRRVKTARLYTPDKGAPVGIEGGQISPPDFHTLAPELELTISGGHVQIGWGWQGCRVWLDQIEIEVDRGDGAGFVLLTFDTSPGYTDPTPLPAIPARWKYRAIYRVADERVGQWSAMPSIAVGG